MIHNFKPQLCPNDQIDLTKIKYPLLASFKLDGIRAVFMNGELYSRSLKVLPNENLHKRFQILKDYSKQHNVILDGEMYCDSVTFNELSGIIRSDNQELPYDLEFWCFDLLDITNKKLEDRFMDYKKLERSHPYNYFHSVIQKQVESAEEATACFEFALEHGFEGIILRNPDSRYKFGRATVKENIAFKVKPFITFDAIVTGVGQATEAREGSEKKINELGRSVTSKKLADRVLIPKASTFKVMYEGKELEVSLAMTNEEKEEIWANQQKYIGKTIEYKGMIVGSKDLPRHATFIRFRGDKDGDTQ
jgi:DNA ligase-1